MFPLKNPRWERFAQLVAQGIDQLEAYKSVGFSDHSTSPSTGSSRLMKIPAVVERIAALHSMIANAVVARVTIDRAYVLDGLRRNYTRAMQEEEVLDSKGKGTGVFTYQGAVANRALELLGKELGMFVDRSEALVAVKRVEDIPDAVLQDAIKRGEEKLRQLEAGKVVDSQPEGVQ